MKRGIAAAWIGGIVVLGTGIGLHLRNQTVAGAKVANSAMENTERAISGVENDADRDDSEQGPSAKQSPAGPDGRVRPTAVETGIRRASHSPAPPSRVLPGDYPVCRAQAERDVREHASRSPTAPTKILPAIEPPRVAAPRFEVGQAFSLT